MILKIQALIFFSAGWLSIITLFTTPVLLIAIIFGLHWKYALISAGLWLCATLIWNVMNPN